MTTSSTFIKEWKRRAGEDYQLCILQKQHREEAVEIVASGFSNAQDNPPANIFDIEKDHVKIEGQVYVDLGIDCGTSTAIVYKPSNKLVAIYLYYDCMEFDVDEIYGKVKNYLKNKLTNIPPNHACYIEYLEQTGQTYYDEYRNQRVQQLKSHKDIMLAYTICRSSQQNFKHVMDYACFSECIFLALNYHEIWYTIEHPVPQRDFVTFCLQSPNAFFSSIVDCSNLTFKDGTNMKYFLQKPKKNKKTKIYNELVLYNQVFLLRNKWGYCHLSNNDNDDNNYNNIKYDIDKLIQIANRWAFLRKMNICKL